MKGGKGMRGESRVQYEDRRPVHGRALFPAIALGAGAGIAVFYIARLFLERTSLEPERPPAATDRDDARAPVRG